MQDNVTSLRALRRSLRLAVVGTGALGSEICRLLLRDAHPHVLLIDPDRVEPHNAPMSSIFQQRNCVGQCKVEVIADEARAHGLAWQTASTEIADVGLAVLRNCDVLVSATDSALSRVETAFAARSLRLPMLDAAVHSHGIPEGRVSAFAASDEAACFLCGFSESRRAELLAFALSASLGCQAPGSPESMTGARATVDTTATALVGLLTDLETASTGCSFAVRLHTGAASEEIRLTRSHGCPWHMLPPPASLVELPYDEPISQLLAWGAMLELPWPVCPSARCRRCGTLVEPMRRTALVRRGLCCPVCDQPGTLDPLGSVQTLGRTHPLAARTLRELGLPERQLYHLRPAVFAGELKQESDGRANASA